MDQEKFDCLVRISQQISNMHQSESRLSFKKQLHKFLEKLKSGESLKQHQNILICYLNNGNRQLQQAINNPANHKCSVQQQIITILLRFIEVDQPQVCDSQSLCETIVNYLKTVFKNLPPDEYFQKQLINLINLLFWKKKIFEIPYIEINELDIADSHQKINFKVSLFSNKSLQQLLRDHLLQYTDLQTNLLLLPQSEVKTLVLELSTFYFTFPEQLLNGNIMVENKNKLLLLTFEQQISFFLQLQQLDNEKLDIITQLIFQNSNMDISVYVPEFIYIIANSKTLDFDRGIILLKKMAKGQKFELNYEHLRSILVSSTDKLLNNFILDAIQSFEKNQDDILKQEIAKYSNPSNVIHLVIQLLTPDHFDYLYEKLINKSISPYQYLLLHILVIIQDKPIALNSLQEQCLRFQLNEIGLVQIFSLYSFQNINQKRKMKLLAQFQQIVDTESNIQFYDVLSIIGSDTTQQPVINHKIGAILNREWNNISNFLKQITYKKQAQIIQGFYYVVMYFTDQNESEFLRLFDIIHKSMCTRNKAVNYTMLVSAIQQHEQGKIETEIQLYVMLLKINYILSDNVLHRKKQNEEISERSSEMGDLNEEQEHQFYQQIQEHGIRLIHQFENKIKLYEKTHLAREEKIYEAVEISRLLLLSEVKINVIHSLTRDERILAIINEPNLIESDVIWESLKKYSLVSLATSIIQIFKNEKILKLIKMMIVELSKLCKYRHYPLMWKQYDILYVQQNQLQPISKINILQMIIEKYQKILKIDDNYEFLKLSYQQVQKSQVEQLGLLIAISLYCGISNTLIQGMGQVSDFCINKLIVQFSNSGLLQLVLTLVKPVKQQRKRKSQMDVEKKLEDYLNNSTHEAINIVIMGIQKDLNKNQDLKQEFINLANKVYQVGQSSDYPLIFDLFDKVPQELAFRCLKTITDQDLDQKLQHIITLINKCEKYMFPAEFYEHSYQIIINSTQVSQIMIDYCFLMINMIKMNETGAQQSQVNVDVTQLKEILIPEDFLPTGCTQQNTQQQQQVYICLQCVNANKRNIICCASCAFSCHKGHQIEYENLQVANCECNSTKKCNQQRQRQTFQHSTLRRELLHHPMVGSGGVIEFLKSEREFRDYKEFREMELNAHISEYKSILREQAIPELDSEVDLEDSLSSSQLQLNEESNNNDPLEKSQSSNSVIEVEQNQFEEKQEKQQTPKVMVSNFFSNLQINFQLLLEKLVNMCHFAFQSCSGEDQSKILILEEQEFDLPSKIQFKIEKVTNFSSSLNNVQLRTDIIEIYNELRKSQENIRQKLIHRGSCYLPFQIRKLIDEGEGNIAIVHQTEIKLFNKNKLLQIAEKKNIGQLQSITINCRFPVTSIIFNPSNSKQLIACGQQELHLLELKDGTVSNDRTITTRFQNLISKNIWVNGLSVGWLAQNQIYIFNLTSNTQSQYFFDSEDKKIKDFCVVNKSLLCIDFEGNIYHSKLQAAQIKLKFTEKINLENHLKGKSKDVIPYCLACISNTSILLISYKNGASFLCNFENSQFTNIVRLDELLASQQLDGLLSCPQLIQQNQQTLKFATLAQKQTFTSQQLNFHQGKLLIIEINKLGIIYAQQVFDTYLESYHLIKSPDQNYYALGLQDNRQLICTQLNFKDQHTSVIAEKKSENQDQIFNSIKERFDHNLLKQAASTFPPLLNFCLPPSTSATPQQFQIGSTSITVSQGFAITGIVFHKPTTDSVEIFKYRTIHKKNNMMIVPLNYLEQIYTFLHHTVTFTQNNYNNVQVYIQKMTLSQALMIKMLQILSQEINTQKEYVFQDTKQRYNKLKSLLSEPLIGLVNSLDCLGITLQAYNNSYSTLTIVPQIVKLIQNNQPVISESAKKLLKILLKNQKTILGGEYDYKSIKDRIFIERIKNNMSDGVIQTLWKLNKIATNRLPQLFYVFNQIPNIIFDLLIETTNYKTYSQILLRYLQFLLNCQKDTTQTLQQIEEMKSQWKIANQNLYNRTFIDELLTFQRSLTRDVVEYAWNVFPQDIIQYDRIEVEQSEDINKSSPYVDFNIDEIANDFGDDLEIEAILFRQELALHKQQSQQQRKKENVPLQLPPPKPAKQLIIEEYDIVKAYVKWLSHGIKDSPDGSIGKKELQFLIQLTKQFYMVIKASKKLDLMREYLAMINLKSRNIQSILLLTLINGKNTNDDLWNAFNRYSVFLDIKEIFDVLKTLNIPEIQTKTRQRVLPFDKFRDILKSDTEQQYPILALLLEKRNHLFYLQIIKYLLGAVKISVDVREEMHKNEWTELICQGKLNPQLKTIASNQLKQLLQQIIVKQDYHRVKDINLYKSQINELQREPTRYADRQLIFQALERIHKACKKRPQIWKEFCCESVLRAIKSQQYTYPKETLEIIEVII